MTADGRDVVPDTPGIPDGEVALGHVVGLRSWRIGDDGTLWALMRRVQWADVGDTHAKCLAGTAYMPPEALEVWRHDPPWDGDSLTGPICNCGLHAFTQTADRQYRGGNVTGIVHGTGRVVEGPRGFRAERARVVALLRPVTEVSGEVPTIPCRCGCGMQILTTPKPIVDPESWAALLARRPGLPVYDTLDALVDAHPLTPGPAPGPGRW